MLYLRTNIEIQQFYERFEASLFAYCFSGRYGKKWISAVCDTNIFESIPISAYGNNCDSILFRTFFNDVSLPRALQLAIIIEFVKFFAGFWSAQAYVMKIFSTYMLEVLQPESRIKRFVGYTLALYMLFDISIFVIRLFIELPSIVDFLPLLLAYVIWNSQRYMEIRNQKYFIRSGLQPYYYFLLYLVHSETVVLF